MRRALAAVIVVCLAALAPLASQAQSSPSVTAPFTFTAVNQQVTLPINGQSACSVAVATVGGGATLVPSASTDTATYTTTLAVGSGSITTAGTYTGNVSALGVNSFRLQATALTSTAASGTITCTALPYTPIVCDQTARMNATAASAIVIPHVAGKTTYVCSYAFSIGQVASTSATLDWGTGAACGANTVAGSPILAQGTVVTGNDSTIVAGIGSYPLDSAPTPGTSDYCIVIVGATTVTGIVRFTQI